MRPRWRRTRRDRAEALRASGASVLGALALPGAPAAAGLVAALPLTLLQRRRGAGSGGRGQGGRAVIQPPAGGCGASEAPVQDGRSPGDAMAVLPARHPGYTPRSVAGLTGYERVLARAGLSPVAGIDEAGRGACAGPLVVAAVAFGPRGLAGLRGVADSKALTAKAREKAYDEVVATALAWHAVVIPSTEIDELGLHVCNIAGMRRALAGLACQPAYVLTDGFAVRGLGVPALAMWKGDEVAACVAAASVVAKVTRDRIMRDLHLRYPEYGFARHKGYSTPAHMKALGAHGPCPEHRRSFVNVSSVACGDKGPQDGMRWPGWRRGRRRGRQPGPRSGLG